MGADYDYYFEENKLKIIDLDLGGTSVTNDIEDVLTQIRLSEGDTILNKDIIYRDSDGNWDSVTPTWLDDKCVSVDFFCYPNNQPH
jgi:hypothetical protein